MSATGSPSSHTSATPSVMSAKNSKTGQQLPSSCHCHSVTSITQCYVSKKLENWIGQQLAAVTVTLSLLYVFLYVCFYMFFLYVFFVCFCMFFYMFFLYVFVCFYCMFFF